MLKETRGARRTYDLIKVKRRYAFYFRDSKNDVLISYAGTPMIALIDGVFLSKVGTLGVQDAHYGLAY